MKTVILAAGKGTRMLPLTQKVPKPLMRVHDKPLIEWIVRSLPENVDELHVVVGYLGGQIKDFMGEEFLGKKVFYYVQEEVNGTWPALLLTKNAFNQNEKFLFTYADDVYDKDSISNLLKHESSILVAEVENPRRFGVAELDEDGNLKDIEEKPENPKTNIVAAGVYFINSKIFDYKYPEWIQGEKYFTNVLLDYIRDNKTKAVFLKQWVSVANPDDLIEAHKSNVFDSL